MFDEIGVRLQIRYKSLKAKNHHGSPNVNIVTVNETIVTNGASAPCESRSESNDSERRGGFCRLHKKKMIALVLFICIITITGIAVGITLNIKNDDHYIIMSTTTSTISTTSTTTLHWSDDDYQP